MFAVLASPVVLRAQERPVYDSKGKRDPFIPLVTPDGRLLRLPDEGQSGLALEGIIYDGQGTSYAIVNGEVVKVNDMISGYQVLGIRQNKVTFMKEGQKTEIELKEDEK
ncbi:MAG: hypothetical protein PHE18_02050 [Candidatus Omnitrophica bacterium]|nr:hypothetical protein [Candidatus Omnitrophota bacterium]MDD5552634.1 hypothetical protein [Candidatus Omnitrophota bacterium]